MAGAYGIEPNDGSDSRLSARFVGQRDVVGCGTRLARHMCRSLIAGLLIFRRMETRFADII